MSKSIGLGLLGAGAILLAILLTGCSDTPSPTPSAEAVPSPTVTAQPGVTPVPTPVSTTPTAAPTATLTRAQSASDRAVLVALYHSTDGASWDANTNWLSDRPIGEWHGVATNSNGRVIKLELPGNNLTGTLPAELGGLSNLTELYLRDNQLTGEIPPELGGLSNLTAAALGQPVDCLAPPVHLTRLNQLTGEIPPELGRLSNLRHTSYLSWSNLATS